MTGGGAGSGAAPARGDPPDDQVFALIASTCADLRRLGRKPVFRTVNYLLDRVRMEAERLAAEARGDRP